MIVCYGFTPNESSEEDMKEIDIAKSWDALASDWFQKNEFLFGDLLWGPLGPYEKTARLLPNIKGKKVLVAGCGSGPDVWWLAKRGAKVVGIDISAKQLQFARARMRRASLKAGFRRGDLDRISRSTFPRALFDLVISNYAFQYVENFPRLFGMLAYWLKRNGLLVYSLDHPILYATRRSYLRKGNVSILEHFDYFNERKRLWNFVVNGRKIRAYSFHRMLSSIHNSLVDAGFMVEKILEPKPTVKPMEGYQGDVELAKHIPYTVIFVANKR